MYIDPSAGTAPPVWGAATSAAPRGTVSDARRLVDAEFLTWARSVSDHAIAVDQNPDAAPAAPVFALRVTTGVGKSHRAMRAAVDLVRDVRSWGDLDKSVVLAVPRHVLADEFAAEMAALAEGLTVRVYKGRDAGDLAAPGQTMCRRSVEAKAVQRAGGSVERVLCKSDALKCAFYDICGTQRQRRETADIWIVPHALLWRNPPKMIDPLALIVDEDPSQGAFGGFDGSPRRLSMDDMLAPLSIREDADRSRENSVDLSAVIARLGRAIFAAPDGRIAMSAITGADLSADNLSDARKLVWQAMRPIDVGPATDRETALLRLDLIIPGNRIVLNIARLLGLLIDALKANLDFVPGLFTETVSAPSGEKYRAIRLRWLKRIAGGWNVPTVITSATAHPAVLQAIWPALKAPVSAEAAMPHVTVRQVTDRGFGASSVTPSDRAPEASQTYARNLRARLLRYIEMRAGELGGKMLVIAQDALVSALRAEGLPAAIETVHFNGLSGSDVWRDVRGVIVIGRTMPPPSDVEARAEILSQQQPERIDGWYPLAPGFLDLRGTGEGPAVGRGSGKGHPLQMGTEHHPDALAEALRWCVCEGELIQAIGRGRGVNRTADTPLSVDILTAIPLPIAVDEAEPFEAFEPSPMDLMAVRGVMAANRQAKGAWNVVAAVLPDLFRNPQSAKDHQKNNPSRWKVPNSIYIRNLYRESASGKLKLDGARYAVPVAIKANSEDEAQTLVARLLPGSVLTDFQHGYG